MYYMFRPADYPPPDESRGAIRVIMTLVSRHGTVLSFFLQHLVLQTPPLRVGGGLCIMRTNTGERDCVLFVFYFFSDKISPSAPAWGCDDSVVPCLFRRHVFAPPPRPLFWRCGGGFSALGVSLAPDR